MNNRKCVIDDKTPVLNDKLCFIHLQLETISLMSLHCPLPMLRWVDSLPEAMQSTISRYKIPKALHRYKSNVFNYRWIYGCF